MLLNFLDASLSPRVQCSATAEDDYSEQNLIADPNSPAYSIGFMAYSVVKPPVDLVFTLCCPIELQSILLMTRCGSLKSNGFEVLTKLAPDASMGAHQAEEFRKVGHVYNLKHDAVLFYNTYTATKYKSQMLSYGDRVARCELFLNLGRRALVNQVKISIKCTERCVPVMKRVQIIGIPAGTLPLAVRQSIVVKYTQRLDRCEPSENTICEKADEMTLIEPQTNASVAVPEEFLDCITFEIMSLPMVLPSGKIVDKFTLDRHSQSDETWGRAPSDPFTGVPFSATSKPILNAALKSQIDAFLLINQHRTDIRSIPRTVGSTAKRPAPHACHSYSADVTNHVRKLVRTDESPSVATGLLSLDDSVRLALNSITRFTRTAEIQDCLLVDTENCRKCASQDMLYRINQCRHFVCRTCLLDAAQSERCACGMNYKTSDVVRYFRKDIV